LREEGKRRRILTTNKTNGQERERGAENVEGEDKII